MQPLADRPLGRFARPRRRLRAGLVQLLCVLAGLGLGLLLPRITTDATVASARVADVLIGVGFGVLGLVTVIYSLLFLVVQWAFTSLSPRLNLFRDDPIIWRTFAFAVGVFVFSVTAALVIGDQDKVSVIVPAAEIVAVLAAIALIRTLQVKAFASLQLAPTLAAIAGQGRGILDDLYPQLYTAGRPPAVPLPPQLRAIIWPHRQAILQQLDLSRLLRAADGAVIVLRAGMGDTLQQGASVADLHGGEAADAAVLAGLVIGPERTFDQDPLFAFRLLADIALRALSPAVNDPATAVQVLDTIESLLQVLVSRDLDVAEVAGDAGTVRVVLALPSWDDYLRIALDDLLESAAQSPMVLLQARALLTTLLNAAPPARQPPVTRRLQRAEELGAGNFPLIWHDAAGAAGRSSSAAGQSHPASSPAPLAPSRLRLVTTRSQQWSAGRFLHLFAVPGHLGAGHGAEDAGCRDPAITTRGELDLHVGIDGAELPGDVLVLPVGGLQMTCRVQAPRLRIIGPMHVQAAHETVHRYWRGPTAAPSPRSDSRATVQGPLQSRSRVIPDVTAFRSARWPAIAERGPRNRHNSTQLDQPPRRQTVT